MTDTNYARNGDLHSRLIRFDVSDPVGPGQPPTLDDWVDDAVAVLDAGGSARAALLGASDEGALIAMKLAAAHPERITHLVP